MATLNGNVWKTAWMLHRRKAINQYHPKNTDAIKKHLKKSLSYQTVNSKMTYIFAINGNVDCMKYAWCHEAIALFWYLNKGKDSHCHSSQTVNNKVTYVFGINVNAMSVDW